MSIHPSTVTTCPPAGTPVWGEPPHALGGREDGSSGEGARVSGSCEDEVWPVGPGLSRPELSVCPQGARVAFQHLTVRCFCPLKQSGSRPTAPGPCGPEPGQLTVGSGFCCGGLAPPSDAPASVPIFLEGQLRIVHSRLSPGHH